MVLTERVDERLASNFGHRRIDPSVPFCFWGIGMYMIEQRYQDVKENKLVPLIMLYPHKRNFRQHPPAQIQKIKASLERFGQVRSIVVQANEDTTYTIVAGHGVTEAAQQLEWKELRADILPSWWSAEQITGYLIADNHLSVDATDDEELLATLLREQQDAGYTLASLGSDDETLRQMLDALGDGYLAKEEKLPEPGDADQSDVAERWGIIIECQDEQEQLTLLERFQEENISCRALVL